MSDEKSDKIDYLDRITQESNKPKPKKMVRRSVAVALGIVCIILVLVVSLVGAFEYYRPIINDKDKTISSLNSQVSRLNSNVTSLQYWLDANETYLQNQIAEYNMVLRLGFTNYTIWTDNLTVSQGPNSYNYFAAETIFHAGYVLVNVQSTTNNTYVEEDYYGILYLNRVDVGTSGTMIYPVPIAPSKLPSNVVIMIGNNNSISGANITATVTYYY
jgi:hypothetical protein